MMLVQQDSDVGCVCWRGGVVEECPASRRIWASHYGRSDKSGLWWQQNRQGVLDGPSDLTVRGYKRPRH